MRRRIAAFLVALTLSLTAGPGRAAEDPDYVHLDSVSNGLVLTKYAKPEFVEKMRDKRGIAIIVLWGYVPRDGKGSPEELRAEREQADAVVAAQLKETERAVIAGETQHEKMTTWLIYAYDRKEFAKNFEPRTQALAHSRWKVNILTDLDWKLLELFIRENGGKP